MKKYTLFENPNDFIISTEYDCNHRKLYGKTCPCGKKFYLPAHKYNKQTFCSNNCSSLVNRKKIQVLCAYNKCNCSFYINISRYKNSKTKQFCCCKQHKDLAQRLDGNPKLHLPKYSTLQDSKKYRTKTFYTVEKKCSRCGYDQDEKMLDVHHKDGDRSNNQLENLEVLCLWCHALETRKVEPHEWNGIIIEQPLCFRRDSNSQLIG